MVLGAYCGESKGSIQAAGSIFSSPSGIAQYVFCTHIKKGVTSQSRIMVYFLVQLLQH
jgi:hypothetical protein